MTNAQLVEEYAAENNRQHQRIRKLILEKEALESANHEAAARLETALLSERMYQVEKVRLMARLAELDPDQHHTDEDTHHWMGVAQELESQLNAALEASSIAEVRRRIAEEKHETLLKVSRQLRTDYDEAEARAERAEEALREVVAAYIPTGYSGITNAADMLFIAQAALNRNGESKSDLSAGLVRAADGDAEEHD